MLKNAYKAALIVSLLAAGACGDEHGKRQGHTGSVKFLLDVPGNQMVSKVDLRLVCPTSALDVTKTLDVVRGEVVVVFGGLTPGGCTVSMSTKTSAGASCLGTKNFTVVPATTTEVLVGLLCQGVNGGKDGAVRITATIESKDCSKDRIKLIYANPANVLVGESTAIQAEIYPANSVGTPKYSWSLRNDAEQTATGTVVQIACPAGPASCVQLACTGLGTKVTTDPRTGFPAAGAYVALQYEDDDCFDTEEVWVACLEGSVCGSGVKDGAEECDDGNKANNDGCSSTCKIEKCGDGVIQPPEQCDGTAGVGTGQGCSTDCKLSTAPVCGDGLVNQANEQCDGTAGVLANQQCGTDCKIAPVCGNQIVEAPETCDNSADPTCVDCQPVVVVPPPPGGACKTCIAAIPEIGPYNDATCQTEALCKSTLTCILANPTCWSGVANVACYCGTAQADVDACEADSFVPKGPCAAELKAGAGTNPKNAEVLSRFFDFEYPSGIATVIADSAFTVCRAECF